MRPLQQSIITPEGDVPENESVQEFRKRAARKRLNWNPVVGSLLKTLQDHKCDLIAIDDGEERIKLQGTPRQRRQQAKGAITAVDESWLLVSHPTHAKLLKLWIVLGNEPEETVADYSAVTILDLAIGQFSKKWEGKPCPTV